MSAPEPGHAVLESSISAAAPRMACNYGMFESCEDGSCVDPGEACSGPEADARLSEDTTTTEDAGESCDGAWESCCVDGVIGQCCCPEGMACNYGMFESCEDGSCAPIGMTCEEKEEDASVTPDVVEPADVVGPTEDTSEPADASQDTVTAPGGNAVLTALWAMLLP